MIFTFCNVGRPFLSKGFRIHQIFLYQFMKPCNSFFIAFLHGCIDHFAFVCHCKMVCSISISFSKAVDQDGRILVAVINDKGHRDHIALYSAFFLDLICVISESDKHLFQFIYSSRYIQSQTIQPFLVNIWDIADSLDGLLAFTQLFDPGEGINMPVRSGTHGPVFRIFFKNRLKIRHILVYEIFQRNDDPLFCISEQVIITHAGIKKSVRKISKLGQCQILFICKLVCYKTGPVYMYIGLFFQPFKDHSLIWILGAGSRRTGDKRKFCLFFKWKGHFADRCVRIYISSLMTAASAARQRKYSDCGNT